LETLGPNAGADAITEDVELTGERFREQIRKVRRLTRKPFAVNIPIGVGEGLKYSKKCVEVVIEEAVPVAITSVGGLEMPVGSWRPFRPPAVCSPENSGGHKPSLG
jgi:hypothetical protein